MKAAAQALLRANDRGRYTVPSPRLYPHQWAWDSAFAALGWACFEPDRAVLELETLMAGAWPDGRVPHIYFHSKSADYFPGPEFWRCPDSSSITQPPVWASAALRVLERGGDGRRLAALLDRLDRSHQFFHEQRDPLGWGLVAVVHPWESGLDNSPAWDAALQRIDPNQAPAFRRVDKERVEDAAQRPTDDQYRRYAALVKAIAECGFGPGPMAVYDPLMTTLLARSERDLARLAQELGSLDPGGPAQRAARLEAGLARLWSPEHGFYSFYDVVGACPLPIDVLAAYSPLVLGLEGATPLRDRLHERYACAWPLPSTAPDSPWFDPVCYWRGPTWINLNWLFAPHLEGLAERTLALIERSGFREYYHPHTGDGLGARDFTWTAALALDLLTPG